MDSRKIYGKKAVNFIFNDKITIVSEAVLGYHQPLLISIYWLFIHLSLLPFLLLKNSNIYDKSLVFRCHNGTGYANKDFNNQQKPQNIFENLFIEIIEMIN